MSATADSFPSVPAEAPDGLDTHPTFLKWVDVDQLTWRIELMPQRIVLRSESAETQIIELPARSWTHDIYVAEHGQSFIVRIETFERAVRFMVSAEDAAPLLTHIRRVTNTSVEPRCPSEATDEPSRREVTIPARRERNNATLLWPKVSPLAVWALICSALVFIPALGLLPAVATVVLLILHRRTVRHAQAWRHSRTLCWVAFTFLVAGTFVFALATWGMGQPASAMSVNHVPAATAAQTGRNWGIIAGGLLVVLLSLSVHEAAHAITAWWLGDDLARSLGRVTLNPLAHIDLFGTVLLPVILVLAGGPVFGYARPVPVRVESLPRHRRAHILISLAGPGSNLLLAAASLMMMLALGCVLRLAAPDATVTNFATLDFGSPVNASGFALAPLFGPFCTILKLSFIINVVLAMFNLIPIPPLDGSWVLEHLFPGTLGRLLAAIRPYGFLVFIGAIYMGLFRYLIVPVVAVLIPGFSLLHRATGM